MTDQSKRHERRIRQAREVEASQSAMRKSIAETERLVDESEAMLIRHRLEREADEDSLL